MNERPPAAPVRRRTALSQLGGAIQIEADAPEDGDALGAAFQLEATETAQLPDVHAFHSYPARMHPEAARRLIAALSAAGESVLDPFCGSGTVLVEARRLGRRALGYDVNPLSRELVWLKTLGPGAPWLELLEREAERVAAHADERRKRKAGATQRYSEQDRAGFAPHVLLELDSLRDAILATGAAEQRRALLLVLSALLTKVGQRSGDTSDPAARPKRIAPGFPARFFVQKTRELSSELARYRDSLPASAPQASCELADARRLPGSKPGSVRLVVTSPPYPGVYDYLAHHEQRLRWLGLPSEGFARLEMGSRRELSGESFGAALARWESDLGQTLAALCRALDPSGSVVLMIADSTLAGRALSADRVVKKLAAPAGLYVAAHAAQARPHFHAESRDAFAQQPRREHLLLLRAAR